MNELFSQVALVIRRRRTVKPQAMNGMPVNDNQVNEILQLANYAPNHGMTEPWRFVVYPPEKRMAFCHHHAAMYKKNTAEQKFDQAKYDKLFQMGDKASHIIIAIMKRGSLPKIPEWEERAATAAAIQNILLGATAMGIASYWGSGGMAQHQAMKDFLQLGIEDKVMGILYFGYADKIPAFTRNLPMDEKVKWM